MRGFTLLELLAVMALLALAAVMIVPRLSAGPGTLQLHAAARQIGAALRTTRGDAVVSNRDAVFALDVDAGVFRAGKAAPRRLPGGIAASLVTAAEERIAAGTGGIRFFPDGSSTGGRVLLDEHGRRAVVAVDWLTGSVVIDE
jgi:general secretion pathway protein H